jgi:hypothetical protein
VKRFLLFLALAVLFVQTPLGSPFLLVTLGLQRLLGAWLAYPAVVIGLTPVASILCGCFLALAANALIQWRGWSPQWLGATVIGATSALFVALVAYRIGIRCLPFWEPTWVTGRGLNGGSTLNVHEHILLAAIGASNLFGAAGASLSLDLLHRRPPALSVAGLAAALLFWAYLLHHGAGASLIYPFF